MEFIPISSAISKTFLKEPHRLLSEGHRVQLKRIIECQWGSGLTIGCLCRAINRLERQMSDSVLGIMFIF